MKKLFALLFTLPLLLVACDKENNTPKPAPNEPTLELTSEAVMEFDANGGVGEITYNLIKGDEALDGESGIISQTSPIVISTEQDWITINKEDSIYGVIKFEVAENTADEQRTGYIEGRYSTKSFTVTINQLAGSATPAIEGWAVVGSMTNNWDVTAGIKMESIDGYFVARGVEVATTDSFKFVKDGDMQSSLGGNGQLAEYNYKYDAMKYGSDIRVKEAGSYDLYINDVADTYYVMEVGKNPAEAYENVKPGEDVWYLTGLGEEIRLRKSGIFLSATSVNIDEDGFKLRNTLTGEYGAKVDGVAEVDDEIEVVVDGEHNIKVNVESNKSYDIYFSVETNKLWVTPRGGKPNVLNEATYAEGVWFDTMNFMITLKCEGLNIYLDCNAPKSSTDGIILEGTYSVEGEDGYVINVVGSEVHNESGKNPLSSGSLTIKHISGGYDILVDVVTIKQHRIRAHWSGVVASNQFMGGAVENPAK
jgi:hypothetical protein